MINNLYLCMKRNGNSWRMDTDTYSRFINHVRLFFRERVELPKDVCLKLSYIEIPVRDFDVLCFLFGGYSRDNEELVLMEFYPRGIALPWKKSFTLNLYTEDDILIPVVMDVKE